MQNVLVEQQVLINNNQIQERLKQIAKQINANFNEITFLITLTGGIYTAIDISKYITIPLKLEFVKISSYGQEQKPGIIELKYISMQKGTQLNNVLIIDDIFDTGNTMDYLIRYIKANYHYNSLSTFCLLNKKTSRRQKDIKLDYIGFDIDGLFVYGYGLDLKDYDRNIQDIRWVQNIG